MVVEYRPATYSFVSATMTVTLELDAAATDSHVRRTLSEISLAIAKSKKIVVVTGAGISCSCGIPVRFFFRYVEATDNAYTLGFSLLRWTLCTS